jgi:cob(I)alamin adenosyltransferase
MTGNLSDNNRLHGGDAGTTSLGSNERVMKDDLRIEVCGNIDELSAVFGLVRAEGIPDDMNAVISRIQRELFLFAAEIAECDTPQRLSAEHVEKLDSDIAALQSTQPLPFRFVVPGDNKVSALLHFARTVCRRCERSVTALCRSGISSPEYPVLQTYINRLSGLLYYLAVKMG